MARDALKKRFFWVYIFIAVTIALIAFQLLRLQIFKRTEFLYQAARQHNLLIDLPAKRGTLFDRNQKELATSLKVPSIYAVPRMIPQAERPEITKNLAQILSLPEDLVAKRLNSEKAFIWLKRRVTNEELEQIQKLKKSYLGYLYENKRFYPHRELASQVLGFVNIDGEGIEAVELGFDKYLKGEAGYRLTLRDAMGRDISALDQKAVEPIEGANLILTIDHYIQYLTDKALGEAFEKYHAKGAMAIVMDPKTGEILAMASRPAYDPSDVAKYPPEARRNRNLTDFYEPGSVFKLITASAALNEGIMRRSDTVFCENGSWLTNGKVLHDVHGYGDLTFDYVFVKSSNIGTVKIAKKLGEQKLYSYIKKFGIGELTGIDLPGEVSGMIRHPSQWSKISINAIPIGQEVVATPLQILRAYSVVANGGYLVKPYIVREIRDSQGVTIKKFTPKLGEPVLKKETTEQMKDIFEQVVSDGTGKSAIIPGIRVAGKTGTSQKVEPTGGYSHTKFFGTFVGFAPADDPKLAMIVVLDEPRPLYYGGTVAAPVFKDVIEKSLLYLGVVPKEVLKDSEKKKAA